MPASLSDRGLGRQLSERGMESVVLVASGPGRTSLVR